ncbi:MAG: hypothetical protein AAF515_15470 [Pseudomonadota bacterium]
MPNALPAKPELNDIQRHALFEACARQADVLGGDERTADYFFRRAQASRVWFSAYGQLTVADMELEDWCGAIAWQAPGIDDPNQPGRKRARASRLRVRNGH